MANKSKLIITIKNLVQMEKHFIDVEKEKMPASFFKWKKINKQNDNKIEGRFIESMNEIVRYPVKFYKDIL